MDRITLICLLNRRSITGDFQHAIVNKILMYHGASWNLIPKQPWKGESEALVYWKYRRERSDFGAEVNLRTCIASEDYARLFDLSCYEQPLWKPLDYFTRALQDGRRRSLNVDKLLDLDYRCLENVTGRPQIEIDGEMEEDWVFADEQKQMCLESMQTQLAEKYYKLANREQEFVERTGGCCGICRCRTFFGSQSYRAIQEMYNEVLRPDLPWPLPLPSVVLKFWVHFVLFDEIQLWPNYPEWIEKVHMIVADEFMHT